MKFVEFADEKVTYKRPSTPVVKNLLAGVPKSVNVAADIVVEPITLVGTVESSPIEKVDPEVE